MPPADVPPTSGSPDSPDGPTRGDSTGSGRRRYVTQADIARELGVSRPLVSIALKGRGRISEEKRRLILETAERMGYLGSGIATSLAGNRHSYLIGYLAQSLENPVFVNIFSALAATLEPLGHRVYCMQGGLAPDLEDHHLRDLVSFRPDGVVVAGYSSPTSALTAAARSVPVVTVTRLMEVARVDSILNDDHRGATLATEALIARGHTRIGHLRFPASIPYEMRANGYLETMQAHGLVPQLIDPPQFSTDGAHRAVSELIEAGELPTALFCANDMLALGAMDACAQHGLRVPEDLALIGYDNTDIARRLDLASVDQHAGELGRLAAQTLLARIPHPDAPSVSTVLEPTFIDRRSAGA